MELCDQFESAHKVVYSKKNYRACRQSGQARQGGEFSRTPVNCNNNNSGLFYDYVSASGALKQTLPSNVIIRIAQRYRAAPCARK